MRPATACFSQPMDTVWWSVGGFSGCIGSITWSCVQQLIFVDVISPHINLSIFHRSGLPTWRGALKIFHYLTCNSIPWSRVCLPVACNLTWYAGFPQLRSHFWGGINSCLPESILGDCPGGLGDEPWLFRDHLINQVHGPGSSFLVLTYWSSLVFAFGPPWPLVGLPK